MTGEPKRRREARGVSLLGLSAEQHAPRSQPPNSKLAVLVSLGRLILLYDTRAAF